MLIIAHNLIGINTFNQFKKTNCNKSKSMERLSSGLRINKASDDAAGLSISQKMKSQIVGLEQARNNVQDGISLIQTAEGGLSNIEDYLQRMKRLSVQAANDTLNDIDRNSIQEEMNQLKNGIDSIVNSTNFNGVHLLDGSISGIPSSTQITISSPQIMKWTFPSNPTYSDSIGFQNSVACNSAIFDFVYPSMPENNIPVNIGNSVAETLNNFKNAFDTYKNDSAYHSRFSGINLQVCGNSIILTSNNSLGLGHSIVSTDIAYNEYSGNPAQITVDSNYKDNTLSLQTGCKSNDTMILSLSDVSTSSLNINNIDVLTESGAKASISIIDNAVNKISSERSTCGAYENRLNHITSNLSEYDSNLTTSDARIEDADIAKEVLALNKNSILEQVTEALLSQANQTPSKILDLLK